MQLSSTHRHKHSRSRGPFRVWPITMLLALSACGSPERSGDEQTQLSIGAATSLKPVMVELAADFKKQSGISLNSSFASSGALFAQVSLSAPFEVFLSADSARPEALFKAGLGTEPLNYAKGKLLLASTKQPVCELLAESKPPLAAIPSLNTLAMANPVVAPYGLAAEQTLLAAFPGRFNNRLALVQPPTDVPISSFDTTDQPSAHTLPTQAEHNNPDLPPPGQNQIAQTGAPVANTTDPTTISQSSAEKTQPKLLTAQNAAQTFGLIVSKNADAGLIASTDWTLYAQTSRAAGCAFEVDPKLYAPINHALTLLPASGPSEASRRFAAYLESDRAQTILRRYGFSSP